MSALPIVKFDRGVESIERGALHDCPIEFFDKKQMSFYLSSKSGWNKCPMGYWAYSAFDAVGRKLIVPGIILLDDKNKTLKKFPNYSIRFTKLQIESFLSSHLAISETIKTERDIELKNLTHDLRAIGAEIYNTALTARATVDELGQNLVRQMDSVLAAQQMLSLRLDIVDYESGHSAGRPKQAIPVYRKIDKVLKCFQNRFNSRGMRYRTEGICFENIIGPPIFEIVPFVLVENAIKYAPNGTDLLVRFEDKDGQIIIRFESYGPKIKPTEKDKIFERHFRGDEAKASESSGSGIGLYAAKTLTEAHYGGNLYVNQADDFVVIDSIKFYKTRFTLIFKMYEDEDMKERNRRARSRQRRFASAA